MLSHLDQVNFLATGTSHIEFGIYSNSEPRIYNWGAAGQSFGYEHALFERYVNQTQDLKVALIEVSETRLLMDDAVDQWNSNVYWIHYGMPYNVNVWNPQSYFHITQAYDFFKPMVFKALRGENNSVKIDEQGYAVENHEGRFEALNFDAKEIDSSFEMVYDFNIDEKVIEYNFQQLLGTIHLLQSKGIQVVLIHPPFYKTFISGMPQSWVLRSRSIFKELAASEKLPFWDFTSTMESQQDLFYNDNHLNKSGAQKWTRMLLDSLQK